MNTPLQPRLISVVGVTLMVSLTTTGCNQHDRKLAYPVPSTPQTPVQPQIPTQPQNPTPALPANSSLKMAILSTSDLHNNIRSFDYFKLAEDKTLGFERTSTLIRQARSEYSNTLLVDNGDTIQGTALADYEAQVKPISCAQTLSMYNVMNQAQYDVATLGNHEFNYGLPYLNQVLGGGLDVAGVDASQKCAGPQFPMVLANVSSVKTGKPLLQPYKIITKTYTVQTPDGKTQTVPLKIGVIGFTTPGILNWDRRYLEGKVSTQGAVETAQQYIPQMRQQGADIIVALLHGGLDSSDYNATMENPGLYLSKVKGIDAMIMGHQHGIFPNRGASPGYKQTGVDNAAGTVNGVPAVMPSSWGKALGVIELNLVWDGQKWVNDPAKAKVDLRNTQDSTDKTKFVDPDAVVAPAIEAQHQATIHYVKSPIGQTDFRMSTHFADVGDVTAIQVVNQAQASYVQNYIANNLPAYKDLPVLSVSAPFKGGFQGSNDYTDVAAGPLAIYNAADLYLYPNTVYAVKVTGAQIKQWLENSALRFNQINPALTTPQELINSKFAGYNFDVFSSPDLRYSIDVSQNTGSRIQNLQYQGAPINPAQSFIIATNNYRATSLARYNVPGFDYNTGIIWASPDANRDVVIDYIKRTGKLTRSANGNARSWSFVPLATQGPVTYKSTKGMLSLAQAAGLSHVIGVDLEDDGKGYSQYRVDLSKAPQ